MVVGSIWVGLVFFTTEKISQDLNLSIKENVDVDLYLKGKGLGFYKITIPDYSRETVLVKVFDPQGELINLKRIETKVSVNYFEFDYSGKYTLEVTNLSENPIQLEAEFGNTKAGEITIPAAMTFIGAFFLVWSGYRRLRNYNTAHPEENSP